MNRQRTERKKFWQNIIVVLFWLFLWQGLSMLVTPSFLFAGPLETIEKVYVLCTEETKLFFGALCQSFGNILLGFLLATLVSVVLAGLAYQFDFVERLLYPLEQVMKSIPVASCVIVILLWFGSTQLSLVLTVMVAFPILYSDLLTSLRQTDTLLLEMAKCFSMSGWKKLRFVYLPSVFPSFLTGVTTAYGMSFRAGVAAELIAVPARTIGEQLYYAKVYMDTAGVFAWTFSMLLACFMTEKGLAFILRKLYKKISRSAKGGYIK